MHPHETALRQGYAAFAAGDLATLERLFSPDVVWHEPGQNPISGSYKGWPEVLRLLTSYAERSGGTFKAELSDVLVNDRRAISIAQVTGSRDGRRLDQGDHLLADFDGDRIVEARVLYHDQQAVDAFWS